MRIHTVIVEDQKMIRDILCSYVENDPDYMLYESFSDASKAVDYCLNNDVNLILMDVRTEHGESGLKAAKEIKEQKPEIKIVIVTSLIDTQVLADAKRYADSLWYKDASQEELMSVVKRTMEGEHVFPDAPPSAEIGFAKTTDFTKKEIQVLRYLVQGLSYNEIAKQLHVEPVTVQYHVTNMLQKTGFDNKLKLAIAVKDAKFIYEDL